jgi:hypothetical protein
MFDIETSKARLIEVLDPSLSESSRIWLQDAIQAIHASSQPIEDLGLYSAMAKRKLGNACLEHANAIDTNYSPLDVRRWTVTDAARLILLMSTIEHDPGQAETVITNYYRMGDESEHIAVIRGLIFFAPGDYLTVLALDAGRTNNLELLAALILDNPYPACFYGDHEFNQMVLKGLFLGLAIERVEGIEQRANPDLTRMCENYVGEREAAGRTVPMDIWLAIGPFATEAGRQKMLEYLAHEETGHRYYTVLALGQLLSQHPSLSPILRQRLDIEQEPMIRTLLQDTLQTGLN